MLILGIDSSAACASAAVWDGRKTLSEITVNNRLTHSQTLLPMVEQVLSLPGLSLASLGLIAVSAGPGSFTGLRIGISMVKGLCCGASLPCLGVSTLEALAYNLSGFEGVVCSVMDARVNQVYQGFFSAQGGRITRLKEDRALSVAELEEEIKGLPGPVWLVGDGAELCSRAFGESCPNVFLAPAHLRYQRGDSVARLAGTLLENGTPPQSPKELLPSYLRLSQAERERKARQGQGIS